MKKLVIVILSAMSAMVASAADHVGGTEISGDAIISDKTFSGTYEKSIYIIKGGGNDVIFENCTFDGVSADANGSCIYIDRDADGFGRVIFKNCKFINCGNTRYDGGAIYVQNINRTAQGIIFENCEAIGCKAENGGFMYINDNEAVVMGGGSTVIAGCAAEYGGGVYANRLDTFDGFILADNTATERGGGLYDVNTYGRGNVFSCRFYRNAADDEGGGLYVDDSDGSVMFCRFLENTASEGADFYIDDDSTTREGNLSISDFQIRTLEGDGTETNPIQISDIDEWDTLCSAVKGGKTYENTFILLTANIVAYNSVGFFSSDSAKKKPFKGSFNGNGRTISLYSFKGSNKATFSCAVNATVQNLSVNGRVEGGDSLGAIFGNASGSTAMNCVNKATIKGTGLNVGGIAGWVGNGSKLISCINDGEIVGADYVGGIVGCEDGVVSVENCHSFGSARCARSHAGGITGNAGAGSTHERCFYCKDHCPNDDCGIGVSHEPLWGDGTETLFELPKAMEEINGYIKAHNKEKDGWLRVALDRNGQPVIVPNGPTDELGYSVKKTSETGYIFWKLGKLYTVTDGLAVELPYTLITRNNSHDTIGGDGWYVVEGIVMQGIITVNGSAHLILWDGCHFKLSGVKDYPGIGVMPGNALEIFGGPTGSGRLTATGGGYGAGIGGGHGQSGGTVNIYGGTVTATGGDWAAGIGGGDSGAGGTVTINGGVVTATGGWNAAGIGGGSGGAGGTVTINGGIVTATGGFVGAGIGGGIVGAGGTVTINGGTVTAVGREGGAGIGGGSYALGGTVTINGGTVTAVGQNGGKGIGGGILSDNDGSLTLGPRVLKIDDNQWKSMDEQLDVEYALPNGTIASTNAFRLGLNGSFIKMSSGWYVVTNEVNIGTIEVCGEANLILADEAKLTVTNGFGVEAGNTLTIYAQSGGSGMLVATGVENCAGIGGQNLARIMGQGNCGNIIINGGVVTATGGMNGAGIGGGALGTGGYVTINAGFVTATGGMNADGIGKGSEGTSRGSLILGPRVLEISDNQWKEGVIVTFDVPAHLRFDSAQVDGGQVKSMMNGKTCVCTLEKGYMLALTFGMINDYACSQEFKATVTLGPISEDTIIDASELPKGEMNEQVATNYAFSDGMHVSTNAYPLHSTDCSMMMSERWYVVTGEKTTSNITVKGEVNLILADGAKLTVNGGIEVDKGNTLTIYAQLGGNGELVANGKDYCAGIGGRNPDWWEGYGNCGKIIIMGGKVMATGGSFSAGIGGAFGAGGDVTINGGTVTATGGRDGAGIGGAFYGAGGTVTVNGGMVTAVGRDGGKGIGGGAHADGGSVCINGGRVKSEGRDAFGEKITLGKNVSAYDITEGEPGTLITDEALLTSVDKILTVYDSPVDPTCEGGEIAEVGGEWIVTPNAGVTAVTIAGLPEGAKLAVKLNGYNVPSEAFMGWGVDGKTFSLALNPDGVVDGVPVKPTIGDLDAGEPFVVGEGSVAVTVRAIPGLKYSLIRGTELGVITETVVEPTLATEAQMTLKDIEPPASTAFYQVVVSVP